MKSILIKSKAEAALYICTLLAFNKKLQGGDFEQSAEYAKNGQLEEITSFVSVEAGNNPNPVFGTDYNSLLKLKDGKTIQKEWGDFAASILDRNEISALSVQKCMDLTVYTFGEKSQWTMELPIDDFQVIDDLAKAAPPKPSAPPKAPGSATSVKDVKMPATAQPQQPTPAPQAAAPSVEDLRKQLANAEKALAAEQDEDILPGRQAKVARLRKQVEEAEAAAKASETAPAVELENLNKLVEAYPQFGEVVTMLELLSEDAETGAIATEFLKALNLSIRVEWKAPAQATN